MDLTAAIPRLARALSGLALSAALLAAPVVNANLLTDFSFENEPVGTNVGSGVLISDTNTWHVDGALVTGATLGVTPLDGNQMLRCINTSCNTTDVYHAFDLRPFASEIADGRVSFDFETSFNANAFGADVVISLQTISPAALPANNFPGLAQRVFSHPFSGGRFDLDGDPSTWQSISLSDYTPTNPSATFLLAGVHLRGNGQALPFADNAVLTMSIANVPEPGMAGLLGLGLMLAGLRRRAR